jgi:Fe-S cluster biogenesis protein NfuA
VTHGQGDFERRVERIDGLVARLDAAPDPKLRETARELVQSIMDLHGAGLARMLELIDGSAGGLGIIQDFADDELVGSLLLLYDLHPIDFRTRVEGALEKSRPYLRSHGGDVELIDADPSGVVRLRLEGSCQGCPSSSVTLKLAIEQAIRDAAPDTTDIVVEGELKQAPRPQLGVQKGPLVALSYGGGGGGHVEAEDVTA